MKDTRGLAVIHAEYLTGLYTMQFLRVCTTYLLIIKVIHWLWVRHITNVNTIATSLLHIIAILQYGNCIYLHMKVVYAI